MQTTSDPRTPESTFTPSTLDLTRYGLAAGTGIQLTPKLVLDLTDTAIFQHNRHVNNATTATPGGNAAGTYKNFTNLFMGNLTYRFR